MQLSAEIKGIKTRINLNGGKALLDFENGDIGIEDSENRILVMFRGTEVQNFTEEFVGLMTTRVTKEMTKSGIL